MTAPPLTGPGRGQLLGVDVGGSGIKAAVVDLATGTATGRIRLETPQPATPDAVAATIAALVGQFDTLGPIGATMPGVVLNGVVRSAAHIDPAWIGTDAAAQFASATGRPCAVVNDADAAGMAETLYGAGHGLRGVVVTVTVGTGLGTAVVHDGVLVPNAELGHIIVDGELADDWASDAARTREDLSWKRWARRFERYLTELHDLVWPELFIIGGGVAKNADKFMHRLDVGCEVRVAELGNLAGIVGAALVADAVVPA
jgi:polyphosphate glucokinase